MESGNANSFQLTFTTEKEHFNQANILSIKRTQNYKITYRTDHPCIFRAVFVTSYRFYLTNLNFLKLRCRKINNRLDMTLNGEVSALTQAESRKKMTSKCRCNTHLRKPTTALCYRVTDVLPPNFEFLSSFFNCFDK